MIAVHMRIHGWSAFADHDGVKDGRDYGIWERSSGLMKDRAMLFMVIERFRDNDMLPIYKRVRDEGRLFPEGLDYVESWVEPNFSRCFQLMRCDDARLLQEWVLKWRGYGVDFEIVPVVSSKETREVVAPHLDGA